MISSCMFSSAPIVAKNSDTIGIIQQAAAGERADERADDGRKRAEAIDDDPRAADEQHDGDDVGRRDEAARDGDERAANGPTGAGSTG